MPHLIGVQGPLGAGKSTTGTFMAWLLKNEIEAAGGHVELFANFDLYGAYIMKESQDWFRVADAQGSICVWDEAHRSFDSRRFMTYQNQVATDILTFVRKMASIQIFITPNVRRLDTRIREIMEVLITVRKVGNRGISLDYYDFQDDQFGAYGRFLHSRFLPASKLKQIHALNLFDSHSFIRGFPLPKTEREANRFMDELEKAHDEARFRKQKNTKEAVIS